jgi:TrmH family RNA methyltransferase
MLKQITSPQNPYIKNTGLLVTKARERGAQGLFVAEGLRELELAFSNGYEAEAIFFDETVTPFTRVKKLLEQAVCEPGDIIAVNKAVFEKIAYRTSVPNVVAVFKTKKKALADLRLSETPLLLVMESVEKPGNLGAMLRTADAAGADAVLVCDPHTDLFNPNVVRASLGAIFTVPVVAVSPQEAVDFLKKQGIRILATWLEAAKPLYDCNLAQPLAFVLGAESAGISTYWVEQADERIIIPMAGQVDSLNVSASAAVVLFEAVRQRRKP